VYSIDRRPSDLAVVFALGILGFLMRRYDYPIAPLLLGLVLGPLIDLNFRRGMIMTDGSVLTLLTRPGTAVILAVGLVLVLAPHLLRLYGRISGRRELATLGEVDD